MARDWTEAEHEDAIAADRRREPWRAAALAAWRVLVVGCAVGIVAITVALCQGCGGPPDAARATVRVGAQALVVVDQRTAEGYAQAADRALAASETIAEYRAAMEPWDAVEATLRAGRSMLLVAEGVIDTWDAGGSERWLAVVACLVTALADLRSGLDAVGLPVPDELSSVLGIASAFAGGVCHE